MIHLLVFLLSLAGFAALALAMDRHQSDLFGQALSARATRKLRWAGWVALGAALAVIVSWQGWPLGLVSYSGHTSMAAGVVFAVLIFHERRKPQRR